MGDNRKEMDPSGQEHIEGEQNGQTVQPLVDDQNVKPSADEIKKARKREADKKCRDRKKQKMEANESQLENERADNAELKKILDKLEKKYAALKGKLKQSQKDMELIIEVCRSLQQTVEQQNTITKQQAEMNEKQNTMIYELTLQLAATMEQQNAAIQRQNAWENMPQPPPPLSDGGLIPGADLFVGHGLNCTSSPGAAMVSSSSLMQEGSLAPGGQLSWGITPGNTFGTMEAGPSVPPPPFYPFGTAIRPEGPAIEYSLGPSQSPLYEGWPHGDNSEQPTSYNANQFPGVN